MDVLGGDGEEGFAGATRPATATPTCRTVILVHVQRRGNGTMIAAPLPISRLVWDHRTDVRPHGWVRVRGLRS
jgi:hypothetical protein